MCLHVEQYSSYMVQRTPMFLSIISSYIAYEVLFNLLLVAVLTLSKVIRVFYKALFQLYLILCCNLKYLVEM